MTVRVAKPNDVPAIHEMIVELAIFEREADAVINTIESLQRDLFEREVCHALVVEKDHEPVAFALYYFGYSTWKGTILYLEDLYVKETHRKGGYGQLLFNKVVEIAKETGVKRMDWQVLEWNESAIAFYQKNNAILDHDWINGRLFFA
jgi:GNAT superfamily N-acetyltransferase